MRLDCYAHSGHFDWAHPNDVSTTVEVCLCGIGDPPEAMRANMTVSNDSDDADQWNAFIEGDVEAAISEAYATYKRITWFDTGRERIEKVLSAYEANRIPLLVSWYEKKVEQAEARLKKLISECDMLQVTLDDLRAQQEAKECQKAS